MYKAARTESRGRTSQPPRGSTSTQQRSGKAQRLSAWLEGQTILPKYGKRWILELISGTEGSIQN
jgi:hypothetical protein